MADLRSALHSMADARLAQLAARQEAEREGRQERAGGADAGPPGDGEADGSGRDAGAGFGAAGADTGARSGFRFGAPADTGFRLGGGAPADTGFRLGGGAPADTGFRLGGGVPAGAADAGADTGFRLDGGAPAGAAGAADAGADTGFRLADGAVADAVFRRGLADDTGFRLGGGAPADTGFRLGGGAPADAADPGADTGFRLGGAADRGPEPQRFYFPGAFGAACGVPPVVQQHFQRLNETQSRDDAVRLQHSLRALDDPEAFGSYLRQRTVAVQGGAWVWLRDLQMCSTEALICAAFNISSRHYQVEEWLAERSLEELQQAGDSMLATAPSWIVRLALERGMRPTPALVEALVSGGQAALLRLALANLPPAERAAVPVKFGLLGPGDDAAKTVQALADGGVPLTARHALDACRRNGVATVRLAVSLADGGVPLSDVLAAALRYDNFKLAADLLREEPELEVPVDALIGTLTKSVSLARRRVFTEHCADLREPAAMEALSAAALRAGGGSWLEMALEARPDAALSLGVLEAVAPYAKTLRALFANRGGDVRALLAGAGAARGSRVLRQCVQSGDVDNMSWLLRETGVLVDVDVLACASTTGVLRRLLERPESAAAAAASPAPVLTAARLESVESVRALLELGAPVTAELRALVMERWPDGKISQLDIGPPEPHQLSECLAVAANHFWTHAMQELRALHGAQLTTSAAVALALQLPVVEMRTDQLDEEAVHLRLLCAREGLRRRQWAPEVLWLSDQDTANLKLGRRLLRLRAWHWGALFAAAAVRPEAVGGVLGAFAGRMPRAMWREVLGYLC